MKKWWRDMCLLLPSFFLAVVVVFAVLGVSPKTAETTNNIRSGTAGPEQEKSPEGTKPEGIVYKDGIYKGIGQGFGGSIVVQVTVSDGRLSEIEILSADGETKDYLEQAGKLAGEIVEKQSVEIDAVSGATYSSHGILDAVGAALKEAQNE